MWNQSGRNHAGNCLHAYRFQIVQCQQPDGVGICYAYIVVHWEWFLIFKSHLLVIIHSMFAEKWIGIMHESGAWDISPVYDGVHSWQPKGGCLVRFVTWPDYQPFSFCWNGINMRSLVGTVCLSTNSSFVSMDYLWTWLWWPNTMTLLFTRHYLLTFLWGNVKDKVFPQNLIL